MAQIDREPGDPQQSFDDDRRRDRVPEAQSQARRGRRRPQRHVGRVRDPVEHPVADDERREPHERGPRHAADARQRRERDAPDHRHEQAVRPRIRGEDQRRERRRARLDADVLDARDQQQRPEQIERGDRRDQPAERNRRQARLGREGERQMSDEHPGIMRQSMDGRRRSDGNVTDL